YEFGLYPDFPRELFQQLVRDGIDLDAVDERSGKTAMINAAQNGNIELVRMLLENGADASLKDEQGMSACDYARYTENGDMLMLFSQYGISSTGELPIQ